ncbi:helix-turn-helix domain-containing protein [Sphingobacterium spiritivorum]|uniref:helix-turn-helix domain-containing protein n=1 Tax=Sphingobacterium spiritivorum TaxID=258 RepID=UPI001918670D|nr:helix-turn-helix transcriptional regulator [Sphingobacterium spiritivorum]QQT24255.1 helix-turn-helix transcriptional regulator [Sphingobacterium spiritivorum]
MTFKLDYYLTTDDRWLRNFSDILSEMTGHVNEVRDNNLILHPAIGEGMFEVITFGDGLSLLRVNCIFHINLKINRSPDPKNEEFIIHLNLSESQECTISANKNKTDYILPFSEAVLYSSSGTGLQTDIHKGDHIKFLILIADRRWITHNADSETCDSHVLQQFQDNVPVHGLLNMDLVDFNTAYEILHMSLPTPSSFKFQIHGATLSLLAHFFRKIYIREQALNKELSLGSEPFTKLKERLIRQLHKPWPPLEILAGEHNMSKTKFIQSFTRIFGKNYSQFYLDARMEKAAQMILEGVSISIAGMDVGYTNLGHFSKIFKRYYGISPRQYVKEKELIIAQTQVTVA